MNRRFLPIACCLALLSQNICSAVAADQPELNFKIYSPSGGGKEKPAESTDSMWGTDSAGTSSGAASSETKTEEKPVAGAAETPQLDSSASSTSTSTTTDTPASDGVSDAAGVPSDSTKLEGKEEKKLLQGYIRIVPSGTKIPIIMDTAVDSDTSQEGDEFAARTGEDLNIDGSTVVPAGSVIKGRIAALNAPRTLNRSGSVALKFDTVTTPDNRQIPIVANLVARGGVVHARRGLKDVAMDTGTIALPAALGIGIGALAGGSSSSSSLGRGGGALVGAGVGAAVGVIVLCIKKGKKVDVRPGDELKIELAEDLRMPM